MRNAFLLTTIATLFLCGCSGAVNPCDTGNCDAQPPTDAEDIGIVDGTFDVASDAPAEASTGLGASCSSDGDCATGICLQPLGRCSTTCATRADCPTGDNWRCAGIPGRGTVCDCAPRNATEIGCNGVDDDCDGVTDDHSQSCNGMCTDIWTDSQNCGGCGVSCANGSVCRNGACACPAARPDICGTQCVNLQTDVMHCGNCTTPCPMQANSSPACAAGICTVACSPGFGDCNHAAGDGCETDVRSDTMNCGTCGGVCSFAHASASCTTGTCVMGACEAGFANCNGSSLDGCEATVANDSANCGSCGNACNAPNATSVCSAGMCSLAACTAGYGNCNGAAADGCEVNLQTSPLNCSVCGGACPARANASPTCTAGTCGFTCGFGYGDCDGNATNGCETPLLSDPSHCGACGTVCAAAPNQTATCNSGACQRACSTGFGDCDGNTANGCETDLRSTLANCGACGSMCSRPNATAVCSAGSCSTVTCNTGFANCDGADFNGCEVNLQNDPFHCGSCAVTCPGAGVPNTIATCTSATCGSTCASGYANCDGSLVNGCESYVAADRNNCGACGNACGTGLECIGAVCQRTSYSGYTVASSPQPFVNACSLPGTSVTLTSADDAYAPLTVPFTFVLASYFGTSAWVSSNGIFGTGFPSSTTGASCPLASSSAPAGSVLAFLDDLWTRSGICYASTGAAPNRQYVVTWNDANWCCGPDAGTHLTFSMILSEGSNIVDVVFSEMSSVGQPDRARGSGAEIGIMGGGSTATAQFACDTLSITAPMGIRYTPY